MKLPAFCLALLFALPAQAADWGILPFPKESGIFRVEDYVDALKMVKGINAPIQVSVNAWSEMEPRTGRFEIEKHLGGLAYGHSDLGLTPYFGISVINTTRRDMPAELMQTAWDDPVMLQRFEALLDATLEKIPTTLPTFIIGNEVDVYFESRPYEIAPYLAFYAKASAAARLRFPQAKIGIAVTYEGLIKGRSKIIKQMVAASDAAFFTYYPIFDMTAQPVANVPAHLAHLVASAQGKDVYLQEIGYPSAMGASEAQQAEFFAIAIPAVEALPQIKLASIFLLHDLDPKLCRSLTGYYGLGNAGALTQALSDFLCSLGVRRLDGTPKPAWDVVARLLSAR